ncbi:MAG: c-type cytochrome [Gemmobacter sp.]
MQAWIGAVLVAGAAALAACAPLLEAGGGARVAAVSGKDLYATYCAGCHGDSGRGDGPAAAGLAARPADLTRLATAAGGTYPLVRVMAKVYGYSAGQGGGGGVMPEFGPLLEGDTVLVETGPGVMTPTPERLVALAEYVGTLQRR